MDAAIDPGGDLLFYSNGYFAPPILNVMPCEAMLGIAQKVNDSTLTRPPTAMPYWKNVNDMTVYRCMPAGVRRRTGLYFSRLLKLV